MDVHYHSYYQTYLVTYLMYGQLTFVFYFCGRLGKLAKRKPYEYQKLHTQFSYFLIIDYVVAMYAVKIVGSSDNMVYIPSALLTFHIAIVSISFGSLLLMMIINGRKNPFWHKRLLRIAVVSFILTIATGIAFTHFFGKTKTISSFILQKGSEVFILPIYIDA